jgi:hypothetical protein
MAMRTASPWWASLAFGFGLLLVFIGERLLSAVAGLHVIMTGAGVGLLLAVTAARAWTVSATSGARRRVERTLLICHVATLFALFLYMLTTSWGPDSLHTEHASGALTVLWLVVLVASLVPVLMIELTLGVAMRTNFDVEQTDTDAGVEYLRVRDIGWSGLTIAFALALSLVTCNVAKERNIQRDVSYFKTSAPGESTQNIVKNSSEPIKVLLFFPDVNEVKNQVVDYFESLNSDTGRITLEQHDRLVDAELASKYKVPSTATQDKGTIVLARGEGDKEKSFTIDLDTDLEKARQKTGKLRNLDREVNQILMKLVREKRKAYLVKGHGEMTDPNSLPSEMKAKVPERQATIFKKYLAGLNYETKDIGLMELSKDVPEDATIVILLAPTLPIDKAEWDAFDRYLMRGGRMMIALDPKGENAMGVLEQRLGIKMLPGSITDDVNMIPRMRSIADRRIVLTSQFSSHAVTTATSRSGEPLPLIDAGALDDGPAPADVKKTVVIRSMETSWLDLNNNFQFDKDGEKKQKWNLAIAAEGPKPSGTDKEGFRVAVFSDVDLFKDFVGMSQTGAPALGMLGGSLMIDTIRWLGGEEVFSGEIVSEEDKPIQHSKSSDQVWFTLTIIGAPLLVLTLGLLGTWARKRRKSDETEEEVTP